MEAQRSHPQPMTSAVLECVRLQLDPWRSSKPRIKSLSGVRSREFTGVHAAGRTAYAHPSELVRTAVNCNPNCNPGFSRLSGLVVRGGGERPTFRFSGARITVQDQPRRSL